MPTTENATHSPADVERTIETVDTSDPIELLMMLDEPEEQVAEEVNNVRVSPHGLGPYPEIPEGAPIAQFDESDSLNMELLGRVMVAKWNEGEYFTGGMIDSETGKVYLNYVDILYVSWEDEETEESTRSLTRVAGGGNVKLTPEQMINGELPSGYTIVDFESGGIDPYEYLDLPE